MKMCGHQAPSSRKPGLKTFEMTLEVHFFVSNPLFAFGSEDPCCPTLWTKASLKTQDNFAPLGHYDKALLGLQLNKETDA
ncbi:hypothetical protein XELAEV_18001914mg [Xenopus laevis]|nr:hypothetical protein XELAEV_18001914mg [Xenopus laevis]